MKKLLALLFCAILLTACASAGRKIDPNAVARIEKGVTTKQQVIRLIGSPDQITTDSDGNITYSYNYVRATAKAASYVPVVGLFAGGAKVQTQSVVVKFDNTGKVTEVLSSYGSSETGMGISSGTRPNTSDLDAEKRDN